MSNHTMFLNTELYDYLLKYSVHEPSLLTELRHETTRQFSEVANLQISPEQGQFMRLLIELLQAKKTLDIGTFTGYSALAVALSLPADGKVYTLDIDASYTQLASTFWAQAGVTHNIELLLGPAIDSLDNLILHGANNSFDFAFIDADKTNYLTYYEQCLQLLKPGGLMVVDNVLGFGAKKITDADIKNSPNLQAVHLFNTKLAQDSRVTLSMLPLGHGLSLARKK